LLHSGHSEYRPGSRTDGPGVVKEITDADERGILLAVLQKIRAVLPERAG
jgi:hypothetical protein